MRRAELREDAGDQICLVERANHGRGKHHSLWAAARRCVRVVRKAEVLGQLGAEQANEEACDCGLLRRRHDGTGRTTPCVMLDESPERARRYGIDFGDVRRVQHDLG